MWFNKAHPNTIYFDIRFEPKGLIDIRPNFSVEPDIVGDFTDLPFDDAMFKLVLFDPPHIHRPNGKSEKSIMGKKFGILLDGWEEVIAAGFSECWRVLDDYGTLVFKWSEETIPVRTVLGLLPEGMDPLFGHTTSRNGKTKWMTFMKFPNE